MRVDLCACHCVLAAELHFSAITSSDFDKRFRCKIKNPYTVVHVIQSTDSIVRLDTDLPTGIIYLQLLKQLNNSKISYIYVQREPKVYTS